MSFYCENYVGKGRKVKSCCRCGCTINKGESAYTIPGENFEFNYDMCVPCHTQCEKDGIDNISDVKMYDEDEDEETLEFQIAGCLYTGDEPINIDELSDEWIAFVESKGWKFCGTIAPLEEE